MKSTILSMRHTNETFKSLNPLKSIEKKSRNQFLPKSDNPKNFVASHYNSGGFSFNTEHIRNARPMQCQRRS
jgi:hypothetical protein